MHYTNRGIICVATDTELHNEHYYKRLWIAARDLSAQISRRQWLDEISNCLRDCEAEIVYAVGEPYPIPLVDDVFGNDADMRFISAYLKSAPREERPFSKSRKIERLRLIDLYFRINYPEIAWHFGR